MIQQMKVLARQRKRAGGEEKSISLKVNVCLDVSCRRICGTNECERKVPEARWHLPLFLMPEEKRRRVGKEGMADDWRERRQKRNRFSHSAF